MKSFWSLESEKQREFTSLQEDIQVDVCIIGGGIAGLTAAYKLLQEGKRVALLERDTICSHTSAGTTGKVTSQHGILYKYLIDSQGKEFAKKYFEANQMAVLEIEKLIEKEKIACDFEKVNAYVFTEQKQELQKIKEEVKATKQLGINSNFVNDIALPLDIIGAIEFKEQAQFHPVKYGYGLANSIQNSGGKIYEYAKVIEVNKTEEEYAIRVANHTVTADYVVITTRYPFITTPGYYFIKMYQSTSYAVLVDTHAEVPEGGIYINVEQPQLSFRVVKDGNKKLLLIVGYDHKTGEDVIGNRYEYLFSRVRNLYPNAEVIAQWCAEDCISLDKIPYIGVFSKTMPNVYVATGFNKWGMTTSYVAASIITDEIVGRKNVYADVFRSLRLEPLKNKDEMKNMIEASTKSLIGDRLKGKDTPTCTHLGCKLTWNAIEKTWDCPCHGSRYTERGNVIEGPAVSDFK